MEKNQEAGLVIRVTGGEVWVEVGEETVACTLAGRFRKREESFSIVAGDRVVVKRMKEGGGVIEEVAPRMSFLSRSNAWREGSEKAIVANLDLLFVVSSVKSPKVRYGFIDRVLVSAERGGIRSCIILNKVDLCRRERTVVDDFIRLYDSCGYRVICTSAVDGDGVDDVKSELRGGIYAFVGQSGVGKSSLLMRIAPELDLRVRDVARKTGRGRHTTSFSELYRVEGGYIADTPGIQAFGFPGENEVELQECFPEFETYAAECRFNPCTHSHEPDCAVKDAVEKGLVFRSRYGSYVEMLGELRASGRRRS